MLESRVYVVQSGDYLEKIAREHGYLRWQELYYHPCNQRFRLKRPNPNRIFVGDVLMIPFLPGKPVLLPIPPYPVSVPKPPQPAPPSLDDLMGKSWIVPLLDNLKLPPEAEDPLKQILKDLPSAPDSKNQIDEWWEKVKPYLSPQIGDFKIKPDYDTMWQLLQYLKQKLKL